MSHADLVKLLSQRERKILKVTQARTDLDLLKLDLRELNTKIHAIESKKIIHCNGANAELEVAAE